MNDYGRIRRAERIVALRARNVDRVEAELAGAVVRTSQGCEAVLAAVRAWQASTSEEARSTCSSADLSQADEYRTRLLRRVAVLKDEENRLRGEEEACRARLRAARAELRKMEIWRDGLCDDARADERAQDRKASDEVALRAARNP